MRKQGREDRDGRQGWETGIGRQGWRDRDEETGMGDKIGRQEWKTWMRRLECGE